MSMNVDNEKGEFVYDPHDSKRRYSDKHKIYLDEFPLASRKIISQYISDMEIGKNVNSVVKKGDRGYNHLMTLISRLKKILELIEQETDKTDITTVTPDEIHKIFYKMQKGLIMHGEGKNKTRYKSTHDYIKIFKAFWHWYQRINRKEGRDIGDITIDLSGNSDHKPEFLYITLEDLDKLCNSAKFDYRVIMMFLFDTGMRAPTEFMNIKRKDVEFITDKGKEYIRITIRDETTKTFGRKIALTISSSLFKQYLEKNTFKNDDRLFVAEQRVINQYLKRLFLLTFGEELKGFKGKKPSNKELTMYDFRHSSCCYWVQKEKVESWIKYRFGWKKSDMIYYYSEFLGLENKFSSDDLLQNIDKHELAKNSDNQQKELLQLRETLEAKDKNVQELSRQLSEASKKINKVNAEQERVRLKQQIENKILKNKINEIALLEEYELLSRAVSEYWDNTQDDRTFEEYVYELFDKYLKLNEHEEIDIRDYVNRYVLEKYYKTDVNEYQIKEIDKVKSRIAKYLK